MNRILARLFAGTPAVEEPWKERRWVYCILLLLSFLAYVNTLQNDFVFDDKAVIVYNPLIQDLGSAPKIFTITRWLKDEGNVYRPISLITFALNHAVGNLNPTGYHLVNIVLHGFVVLCLYALAARLGLSGTGAFLSAAIFAVHPIHTEAVTPIVGRAELLMSLGTLLSLIWYMDSRTRTTHQTRTIVASIAAFTLAMLSKEQGMVLPFLLILYDLSCHRKRVTAIRKQWQAYLLRYVGYFAILGTVLGIRHSLSGSALYKAGVQIAFLDNPVAHLDWSSRLPATLTVGGRYLGLFLWPQHLAADYSYNSINLPSSLWAPAPLAVLLVLCAFVYLAGWSYRHGQGQTFFAIGFTFVTFAPASNILVPIGTIMGERLFYLPSAGLCLLVAIAFDWLVDRYHIGASRGIATALTGAVVVVLSLGMVRTVYRNGDWKTNDSLTMSSFATLPNNAKVHFGLGGIHIGTRNLTAALQSYQEALRIYPDYLRYPKFTKNLGAIYLALGDFEEAIRHLKIAMRLKPDYASVYYNLGYAYLKTRRWSEAAAQFRIALELDPSSTDAKKGLAIAEAQQRKASYSKGRIAPNKTPSKSGR